jgi:putative holliday junction resolvase
MPEWAAPERAAPEPGAPEPRAPGIVLGFDFGQRRIGVACGECVSRTASPLGTVAVGSQGPRWNDIDALMRAWRPSSVVVGLPYSVDGSESAITGAARRFAREIGERYKTSVQLVDERYSSLEAETRLKEARESGLRKRRVAKADVDATAACIILERWLTKTT